ncbi:hypothetical protein NEOLEDRAFT_1065507, partial [Neolentinus lepideus HHB14362 ss-1]
RSGYLVDGFITSNPTHVFSSLVGKLREKNDLFNPLTHVCERSSDQSFFVNLDLIHGRFSSINDTCNELGSWVTFIQLDGPVSRIIKPPAAVISLLSQILNRIPSPPATLELTLQDSYGPESLVPLAALLLEYPIAYTVTSTSSQAILGGVPLDVYQCIVKHPAVSTHASTQQEDTSLIKFSCPSHLAASNSHLRPSRIVDKVSKRFLNRIQRLADVRMDIRYHVEGLDRIAL